MGVVRSFLRTLLGVGLAALLLWLFLRNADWNGVRAALLTADPAYLAGAVALVVLSYVVRAERWQYLLAPLGPTRFRTAFATTLIGFGASSVLPARAGEVLRPYLLARREGLNPTATFATILLERLLDLVAILGLLAAALVLMAHELRTRDSAVLDAVRLGGMTAAPLGLAALAGLYALAGHEAWMQRLFQWANRVLPARVAWLLESVIRRLAEGCAALRRPSRLLAALGWSLVLWLVICLETWAVGRAFALEISFPGSWLLMALLVVGVAVPTPGGVGGFHEAFRLGATALFGIDNNAAVAAALVLHATSTVPTVVLGLGYALHDGLDLRVIRAVPDATDAGDRQEQP